MLRLIVFLLLATLAYHVLHADGARENKIKAAYVHHIINFIQWPDSGAYSRQRMIVCLVGDTAFQSSLSPLTRQSLAQYDMEVVVNPLPAKIDGCHIMYFSNTTDEQTRNILTQICQLPILTLGDSPGFAQAGGMIGFVIHENNVRLEVNISAAHQANIAISAKLLEIALKIFNEPNIVCQ